MNQSLKLFGLITALLFVMGTASVFAQADALVDMLQKKGLLTQREANEVKEQTFKEIREQMPGTKVQLGGWINELKLFGDGRLRYEWREGQNAQIATPTAARPDIANAYNNAAYSDTYARERWRLRLRFGATAKFTDDFDMGLRLETGQGSRSSNYTFGGNAGPWGKGGDLTPQVGQIWLGWEPTDWVRLVGGRFENPLKTTSMVWDGDINPEGAAEKFKYQVDDRWKVFANIAQLIYDDTNPDEPIGLADQKHDSWMFAQQFGATCELNKDLSLTLAPTVYVYSGGGDGYNGYFDGTGAAAAANNIAVNDLFIVEVPLDFKFNLWDQKFTLFGDFAVNALADQRADHAGRPDMEGEKYAYQIGLKWGEAKKKGGWETQAYWQHTELYSLDINLVDSDLFDSRLNMEGVVCGVTYAFTDFLTGSITGAIADRVNNDLPCGINNADIATVNPLTQYKLLQCDLNWKF